jgi:diguanylate cyclase (GGDEF)-like protein
MCAYLSSSEREGLYLLQLDVLEAIAIGKPLAESMDLLCRRVEGLAPELICTVVRVDESGNMHPCASPSMSPVFNAALEGLPIGPHVGSCGTAAFRGEAVEVDDIAIDPLWREYRDVALPLGLASCWSRPIMDRTGRVAATFAVYYHVPRRADQLHLDMIDACVHLVSVAIQHDEAQSTIDRLAFYDQLTGLPNRTLLADRTDLAIATATNGESLAMMHVGLDRFKTINDSLGFAVGNRVLQDVARRLREAVPATDTVCRLGADEFALLLRGVDGAQLADLAERLRNLLAKELKIDGYALSSYASIGISVFPDDGSTFESLLKAAEVAMHQAKESGRNCFRFFKGEMDEAATERLELESAIRHAIGNHQLVLEYQPQIELDTEALYGVEALVRWEHPRWGRVAPERFIPLSEECGLVNDIDAWVLDEACRQLAAWDAEGTPIPAIAVNVSATDFQHGAVPRRVADALARHGLNADRLVLEITETLMMKHSDETQIAFANLRAAGVRIAVDDFGTGYSSLGYLKRFPVTELKLDRSFVSDLEDNRGDQTVATAVIRIGQSLGLAVVAEGVESAAQLEFLRDAGCDVAQGYFFGKPMPADALAAWVNDRSRRTASA